MTRAVPSAAALALAARTYSRAWLVTLRRAYGDPVLRYTSHDVDIAIGADVYTSQPGFVLSTVDLALGTEVGNFELTVAPDNDIEKKEILAGRMGNAWLDLDQCDWHSPATTITRWQRFRAANVTPKINHFIIEFRDARLFMRHDLTLYTNAGCDSRVRFGDARCGFNLAPHTFTASVTSVASSGAFSIATVPPGAPFVDDYFGNGLATFASGLHRNIPLLIDSSVGNALRLAVPMVEAPVLGAALTVVKGCRHRFEDCKANLNVLNFRGYPHVPSDEQLLGGGEGNIVYVAPPLPPPATEDPGQGPGPGGP